MLGHPIADETKPVGVPGKIDAVAQRLCTAEAGRHRRQVEDGEGCWQLWSREPDIEQTLIGPGWIGLPASQSLYI